jgi:hypothetical protein
MDHSQLDPLTQNVLQVSGAILLVLLLLKEAVRFVRELVVCLKQILVTLADLVLAFRAWRQRLWPGRRVVSGTIALVVVAALAAGLIALAR